MKTYIIPVLAPKGSAVQITHALPESGLDDPDNETKRLCSVGSVGFWL